MSTLNELNPTQRAQYLVRRFNIVEPSEQDPQLSFTARMRLVTAADLKDSWLGWYKHDHDGEPEIRSSRFLAPMISPIGPGYFWLDFEGEIGCFTTFREASRAAESLIIRKTSEEPEDN